MSSLADKHNAKGEEVDSKPVEKPKKVKKLGKESPKADKVRGIKKPKRK